jgi:hypothetical protein
MAATAQSAIAVIGIDIGKNSFHVVGLDGRGAIVLRQKWSRGQVEARFANMSPCLIRSKSKMEISKNPKIQNRKIGKSQISKSEISEIDIGQRIFLN